MIVFNLYFLNNAASSNSSNTILAESAKTDMSWRLSWVAVSIKYRKLETHLKQHDFVSITALTSRNTYMYALFHADC